MRAISGNVVNPEGGWNPVDMFIIPGYKSCIQ